jgi:hypothetical protein
VGYSEITWSPASIREYKARKLPPVAPFVCKTCSGLIFLYKRLTCSLNSGEPSIHP